MRESPTKLKRNAKALLTKLRNYGVQLDEYGDVDFSNVDDENVIKSLRKNETLVKITLMHADLEFEYP